MTFTELLPTLNACLNGTATILLTAGFVYQNAPRKGTSSLHAISFFCISHISVFYVLHKWLVQGVHTPFRGDGAWRTIYYSMLLTHIALAIIIVPLILKTLSLAIRGNLDLHKAWARWTFPIWYYVSVTGVLIYCFLYHWW